MDKAFPLPHLIAVSLASLLAGCGGSDTRDTPVDPVEPPAPTQQLAVRAVDGYLKGAQAWLDINGDYALSEGEPNAITDGGGHALLDVTSVDNPGQYKVLVQAIVGQTTDVGDGTATPKPVTKAFTMSAPAGVSTITPLTTLVEQKMTAAGLTQAAAAQEVATQLGLGADQADDLLQDFIAQKNTQGQIYALNLVAALPETLADDTAEVLLAQGSDIGQALEEYLAQNPLEEGDKPEDIKVVIGEDGSVEDVIQDSDGDGKDDEVTPPDQGGDDTQPLSSWLTTQTSLALLGADDEGEGLWLDALTLSDGPRLHWQTSYVLPDAGSYRLDEESMTQENYWLAKTGWTAYQDSDDLTLTAEADGAYQVSHSDGSLGRLSGQCQSLAGRTLAEVASQLDPKAQFLASAAQFSQGAEGCLGQYQVTQQTYHLYQWSDGQGGEQGNSVRLNGNGTLARQLTDLLVSDASLSQPAAGIAVWGEEDGQMSLILERKQADDTAGLAQLWIYDDSQQGYRLLLAQADGWQLAQVNGVSLLLLAEPLRAQLGEVVGFAQWQERVQYVAQEGVTGQTEALLLLNSTAQQDLMRGRQQVSDEPAVDPEPGEDEPAVEPEPGQDEPETPATDTVPVLASGAEAAAQFAAWISQPPALSYSLGEEPNQLGIVAISAGSAFESYRYDYTNHQLLIEGGSGALAFVANADNGIRLMVGEAGGALEQDGVLTGSQVLKLPGTAIAAVLRLVLSEAAQSAMVEAIGTATFGDGAQGYLVIHDYGDAEPAETELFLNAAAYDDIMATF